MDNRKQLTNDKKYLTIVHVVLYLIASHMNYYGNPSLFFLTKLMSLLENKQQSIINLTYIMLKIPNIIKMAEINKNKTP